MGWVRGLRQSVPRHRCRAGRRDRRSGRGQLAGTRGSLVDRLLRPLSGKAHHQLAWAIGEERRNRPGVVVVVLDAEPRRAGRQREMEPAGGIGACRVAAEVEYPGNADRRTGGLVQHQASAGSAAEQHDLQLVSRPTVVAAHGEAFRGRHCQRCLAFPVRQEEPAADIGQRVQRATVARSHDRMCGRDRRAGFVDHATGYPDVARETSSQRCGGRNARRRLGADFAARQRFCQNDGRMDARVVSVWRARHRLFPSHFGREQRQQDSELTARRCRTRFAALPPGSTGTLRGGPVPRCWWRDAVAVSRRTSARRC